MEHPRPMKTVLVVEDDADARRLLREVLRWAGYRVRLAEHGRQALARLRRTPRPCLILLDLRMPVMSGRALLDVLRADVRYRRIPVVLVTGDAVEGVEPGVTALLRKPYDARKLLRAVARHCA